MVRAEETHVACLLCGRDCEPLQLLRPRRERLELGGKVRELAVLDRDGRRRLRLLRVQAHSDVV